MCTNRTKLELSAIVCVTLYFQHYDHPLRFPIPHLMHIS